SDSVSPIPTQRTTNAWAQRLITAAIRPGQRAGQLVTPWHAAEAMIFDATDQVRQEREAAARHRARVRMRFVRGLRGAALRAAAGRGGAQRRGVELGQAGGVPHGPKSHADETF